MGQGAAEKWTAWRPLQPGRLLPRRRLSGTLQRRARPARRIAASGSPRRNPERYWLIASLVTSYSGRPITAAAALRLSRTRLDTRRLASRASSFAVVFFFIFVPTCDSTIRGSERKSRPAHYAAADPRE